VLDNLHITTIQADLMWEDKTANIQNFTELIESIRQDTHVIILPEMFTTGFSMNIALAEDENGMTINWMQELAYKKNSLIIGSIIWHENAKFYNRLIAMQPDGLYLSYDKRHLFKIAEEDKYYSAGDKILFIDYLGWRICPMICYDLRFPVWSRNTMPTLYDILIYIANWPELRSHAWQQLLSVRAIENQSYVIGVNRIGIDGYNHYHSGNSTVIDPMGNTLYATSHKTEVNTIIISKTTLNDVRNKFPFLLDGDTFSLEK